VHNDKQRAISKVDKDMQLDRAYTLSGFVQMVSEGKAKDNFPIMQFLEITIATANYRLSII
jgi:hypothetical protein